MERIKITPSIATIYSIAHKNMAGYYRRPAQFRPHATRKGYFALDPDFLANQIGLCGAVCLGRG